MYDKTSIKSALLTLDFIYMHVCINTFFLGRCAVVLSSRNDELFVRLLKLMHEST